MPWAPQRYAVDYSDTPNLTHLAQADLAIVQPVLSEEGIRRLEGGGTRVIAYLTIGEAEPDDPALAELQAAGCILGQNPNWGSFYVDARCPQWQDLVLTRARALRNTGYAGFLLDTVDTAELFPETKGGLVELIRRLQQEVGGYLVQNRGFAVLESTAPYIQAVMYEDLSTRYDFALGQYVYHEQDPAPVQAYRGRLALLALDYAPADRPALAWRACERARALGFVGYVAYDVNLDAGGAFCDEVTPLVHAVYLPLIIQGKPADGLVAVRVPPFERILYLPHVYGPDVYNMPYFDASDLPAIWEVHFGRMAGRFPLGIGEFGGSYEGKDRVWQDAFVVLCVSAVKMDGG